MRSIARNRPTSAGAGVELPSLFVALARDPVMPAPLATAPRFTPPRSSRWSAPFRRLLAFGTAMLVLIGTLMSGRTYLWCAMMEQRVDTCCCAPVPSFDITRSPLSGHPAIDEASADEAPGIENGCCEDKSSGEQAIGSVGTAALQVPDAVPVGVDSVAPAPVVAQPVVARSAEASASPRIRPIRAGPRSAFDNCVRLQVFRC